MSYIKQIGIKPTGEFYSFTQTEINKLVREFVKSRTGFDLDLTVGCLDEPYDVYISWNDESEELLEAFASHQENSDNPLGLHPEEDFMNRDHIFQEIFGVQVIGYECNFELEEEEYTLFIPN